MTERDFVYWLQGYFEILDPASEGLDIPLGPKQVRCIREHLALVFQHKAAPAKPAAPPAGAGVPPIDWAKWFRDQNAASTTWPYPDGITVTC